MYTMEKKRKEEGRTKEKNWKGRRIDFILTKRKERKLSCDYGILVFFTVYLNQKVWKRKREKVL